jgi:hypothetical protein
MNSEEKRRDSGVMKGVIVVAGREDVARCESAAVIEKNRLVCAERQKELHFLRARVSAPFRVYLFSLCISAHYMYRRRPRLIIFRASFLMHIIIIKVSAAFVCNGN